MKKQLLKNAMVIAFALSLFVIPHSFLNAQRSYTVGGVSTFESSITSANVRVVAIDEDFVLAIYKQTTSSGTDLYGKIGEVNSSTRTITWGSRVTIESNDQRLASVAVLSNTIAVVLYEREVGAPDPGAGRVLTLNTGTKGITASTNTYDFSTVDLNSAGSYDQFPCIALTSTTFAFLYVKDAGDDLYARIGTVSGSGTSASISYGTEQLVDNGDVNYPSIDTLSPTKLVVSYEQDGSTNDPGEVRILEVSGTSINTVGSATTFHTAGSNATSYTNVTALSDDQFVVAFTDDAGSDHGEARVGTVSGTTITLSTSTYAFESGQTGRDITGQWLADKEFMVCYNGGSSNNTSVVIGEVSGTNASASITFGTKTNLLSSGEGDDSWLTALDHNVVVAGYADESNTSDEGEARVITLFSAEINVTGNSQNIVDGDVTPTTADHTDFGSTAVSSGTISRTFTIENTAGGSELVLGNPKVEISGTHASDFSITAQPSSPISGSSSTTFTIQFDPSASGTRSATITIKNSDDDEAEYDFAIEGEGTSGSTTWNGSTWSSGAPNSTTDAVIASSTTPGAFTCKDLTINSTFVLTLSSGVTATIHGTLTNNGNGTSGAGTLNFASGGAQSLSGSAFTHSGPLEITTGTTLTTASLLTVGNGGSLIHGTGTPDGGGSISGSVTFQKTIGSTTDGWRSFSLPVDELIDNFETGLNTRASNSTPAGRRNVYYWDGTVRGGSSNNVAEGWTEANNTTDDENKGYAIYLSNNSDNFFDFSSTVSISGTPNDGTKTFNLDYTFDPEGDSSTAAQRGWNLIPNYFPSNLSVHNLINDADFDPTYKAVHIWDQGAGQLKAMNQSGITNYNTSGGSIFSTLRQIPPFMAFWVKADATSQSVQLKNHMRTSRTDSLPANTYFKTNYDIFRIEVKDQENHMDQYSVCFIDGSTKDFDPQLDIYKFKSFTTEVPTLYSRHGNGDLLSLNAVPVSETYTTDIFFESYKPGRQYTISPITIDYNNYYNVALVDNKTGTTTDLLTEDYSFTHDENYNQKVKARFTLNFTRKATTSIAELQNQERSYAYTDGGIHIVYKNNNHDAQAKVSIYNTLGQQLFAQNKVVAGETVNYVPAKANNNSTIYIIKVESNGKAKTLRVVY